MDFKGFDKPMFNMGRTGLSPQKLKLQNRGGTPTSLISEGGAVGGAIAGGAIGSVVPVVGTAIGAIIGGGLGAFSGRLAENKVRDDRWGVGDAAKEGAVSAVLSGPLKGLKYASSAGKGLKAGVGLEKALIGAADDATKFSLRSTIGKGIEKKAVNYSTKQFGLGDAYIAKFTKKHREDAGKTIMRYGFGSADDVGQEITKQQSMFDNLIQNAGKVKKTTLQQNFDATADDLLKKFPTDQKAAGRKMLDEVKQIMDNFGDEVDATELNGIRKQYDELVNYGMQQADPTKYTVNKRVADVLRETVQKSAGGQLKETGKEISKLIDLQEEIAKRAPALSSRAAGPMGFRNLVGGGVGAGVGATTGGAVGGPIGAIAGMGLTAAANSPAGRRAFAKGTQLAAGGIKGTGRAATPFSMGAKQAVMQPVEGMINQPAPTQAQSLEDAMMDQSMPSQSQMALNTSAPTMTAPAMSSASNMGGLYPNSQQPSNGITRENILKAMMIDLQETGGKNLDKIQMIYDFANPDTGAGTKLTSGTINKINDYDTSLANLDEVERVVGGSSGAFGPITGRLRSLNPYDKTQTNVNQASLIAAQNIGRALEGGKLTDADIARYQQALPNINDTPTTARDKIARLRRLIDEQKNNYLSLQSMYGGGGDSLEDVFMQQSEPQGAY